MATRSQVTLAVRLRPRELVRIAVAAKLQGESEARYVVRAALDRARIEQQLRIARVASQAGPR